MPTTIQFSGIDCVMPTEEIYQILSGRKDGARPNMYKTHWGREPGFGWLLLYRSDFDGIDLTDNGHTLFFGTGEGAEEQHLITGLIVTHYESVYAVPFSGSSDLVLVKVEDNRCIGHFTYLNESYNIRKRTEGTDTNSTSRYYGTAGNAIQTVADIVDDIWTSASLSSFYGTLASDIDAGHSDIDWIENLNYRGMSALDAVIDCCRRGSLEFTLQNDGVGIIFPPNELSSTSVTTQTDLYEEWLLNSSSPQTAEIAEFPEKIEVCFRRVFTDPIANTDTSVFSPGEDAIFNPFYVKEITTSSIDATVSTLSGTKMVLHHDKVMRSDPDVGSNKTTNFDPLATDIATNWINSIKNSNHKLLNIYSGAHPFDHQVFNEIVWYDFGEGVHTAVKLDLQAPRPSNTDWKDEQRITWGFGQATSAFDAYASGTADSGTLKPISHASGTVDTSSTKSLTAYSYATEIASGARVLWIYDSSCETPIMFPLGAGGFKPLVRFTLAAALADTDASKAATITNQYGPGEDNTTSASGITVHNLETKTASTYVFDGSSGAAGLAIWDSGTNYRIIQMECP